MNEAYVLTLLIIVAAVAFDFVNGFHDAANSIATIVATKVLKPRQAVIWASFFNFTALFLFGTGVAKTVGSGMVALDAVTPAVILAGLLGAIAWGVLTWWLGLPTSSSHALIGGYAGAALAHAYLLGGMPAAALVILSDGWTKTLTFIVAAPVIGFVLGHAIMRVVMKASGGSLQHSPPGFARAQLASSAFLSLMHGSNDAQKTAGIIAGALVAGGFYKEFTIPDWVLWLSYATMGLGTLAGGWRIVHTLGHKLTRLHPAGGFSAETAAALAIGWATWTHLPVSTTHVTTGAVLGVGSARRVRAVRWGLARNIVWAWIVTIPASAMLGAAFAALTVVAGLP